MAFSFEKYYMPLLTGAMLGNRNWLNKLNTGGVMAGNASKSGATSISYIASVTAAAVAAGTVPANGTTTTTVDATFDDYAVTSAFKPSETYMLTKPGVVEQLAKKQGNALIQRAQNNAIAALKAGTALSGASQTLASGSVDFAATTDAAARAALSKLTKVISLMMATFTEYSPEDFAIVMSPAAHGNFTAIKLVDFQTPQYFASEGLWRFMGLPVYTVAGATNFGAATYECAFVTCIDSIVLAREEPYMFKGGPYLADDICTKITVCGPHAYGVVNSFFGEVLNPAS